MSSTIGRFLKRRWVRLSLVLAVDGLLIGAAGVCLWILTALPRIPDDLDTLGLQTGMSIYADSGELLYTFNRRVKRVALAEVSPYFIQAVLATEDQDFHHHRGYSLKAIAGALSDNVRQARKARGGSTITQQIVKNLFLAREKTYSRKVKEILLAAQLEAMFGRQYGEGAKTKLLELYINGSFYGTNAYGVEDAARCYFGKGSGELSLMESAVLAGLPNAPTALSPYRDRGGSVKRRAAHVLRRMRSAGWITQLEEEEALEAPIELTGERRVQNRTPYFVETIKSEVARRWGRSALSFGRLDIHTTLDLGMQRAAERAVAEGLADLDRRMGFLDYHAASREDRERYVQGGLICLDPRTGYIRAVVGGRDIFVSYYNRATSARRQVGSGFKPVVYLAAFASGEVTPVSLFVDEPRTYLVGGRSWAPKNFKNSYLGPTTAAWALVRSANSTAVQVVQRIGPERVVEMGERLGIRSPLGAYPSIALGTSEVSLLDVAAAYGTIANYGIRTEPTFIRSIADREGRAVYSHRVSPVPVLDAEDAYVIIRLMENVVDRGTGRTVRALGFGGPAAGKTGTTNENTDAWFVGFTPDLVTGVWVGFDDRTGGHRLIEKGTGRQITGGNGAAPIWAAFMKAVRGDGTPAPFWAPPGVREVWVDPLTGSEANPESPTGQGDPGPIRIALPKGESPNTAEEVARFLEAVKEGSHP